MGKEEGLFRYKGFLRSDFVVNFWEFFDGVVGGRGVFSTLVVSFISGRDGWLVGDLVEVS